MSATLKETNALLEERTDILKERTAILKKINQRKYPTMQKSFRQPTASLTLEELYAKEKAINKVINTKLPKKKQTNKQSIKEAEDTAKVMRTFSKEIRSIRHIEPELRVSDNHNNGFYG